MSQTFHDEINIFECWRILVNRKRAVLSVVLMATLGSAVISLCLPKVYRSAAVIMPMPQYQNKMSSNPLGQLGLGIGLLPASDSRVMPLLKSRTLAEHVVQHLSLMPLFFPKTPAQPVEDGANMLLQQMSFSEDKKNQTVTIAAQARSPKLAFDIATTYIEELHRFIAENTFTEAKRFRIYTERELEKNKVELLTSGKELNSFYKDGRISSVESRVDVPTNFAGLGVPPANNARDDFHQTYASLEGAKAAVEEKLGATKIIREVPQQVYLQYLVQRRELLGKMNALLTQHYEMAKMDEAKEDLAFQMIDPPTVPRTKYKPKRIFIVVSTFALSMFVAIFYAFFMEWWPGKSEKSGA